MVFFTHAQINGSALSQIANDFQGAAFDHFWVLNVMNFWMD
jgi:hypothetical protein